MSVGPDAMLDHRRLVASLGREERAALLRRSDARGAAQLAAHLAAILVLGACIALGAPLWPLLLVPQGILIIFLFTALHECSHRTAFRTEWVNRAVAAVGGFLVLVPPEWFRCFHAAHHRFTHDPARDPELAAPEPRTRREYLVAAVRPAAVAGARCARCWSTPPAAVTTAIVPAALTGGGRARGAADAGRLRPPRSRARSPCAATCCCGSGCCRRCSANPSCAPI